MSILCHPPFGQSVPVYHECQLIYYARSAQYCHVDALFVPGKSNLMDAISFVLGEKTSNLRVKRLSVSDVGFFFFF